MRRTKLAGVIGIAMLGAVAGAWAQGESRGPSAGPGMMGQGMMDMGPGMMGGQWAQQRQQMMNACLTWMGGQAPQTPSPQAPSR